MAFKKGNIPWQTGKVKQFCPKGHDTLVYGRQAIGRGCNQCKKDWQARNGRWMEHRISNADGTPFTRVDFDRAYQRQSGACLGCQAHSSELNRPLFVDHDHSSGIFRALLCHNCNLALGHSKDNPEVLKKLIDILKGKV